MFWYNRQTNQIWRTDLTYYYMSHVVPLPYSEYTVDFLQANGMDSWWTGPPEVFLEVFSVLSDRNLYYCHWVLDQLDVPTWAKNGDAEKIDTWYKGLILPTTADTCLWLTHTVTFKKLFHVSSPINFKCTLVEYIRRQETLIKH